MTAGQFWGVSFTGSLAVIAFKTALAAALCALCPVALADDRPDWLEWSARAETLFEAERYDSAVLVGRAALELLRRQAGGHDSLMAELFLRQNEYHREASQFDSAEACLAEARRRFEKLYPDSDFAVAACMYQLAVLRTMQSRYEEAGGLFRDALSRQTEDSRTPPRELGRTLAGYANLLFRLDRAMEAEEMQKKALDVQKAHLPADDPDIAKSLARLAMLSGQLGRTEQVEPLLLESVRILEAYYGPDHPRVAQMLANLGLWYNAQERRDLAIPMLERSLAVRERALGPDNPKLAFALVNLANCYRNEGDNEKGLPLLRRALSIREKVYGPLHHHVAYSLNAVASCQVAMGLLDSAESAYARVVDILSQTLPPGHSELIGAHVDLGTTLLRQGRYLDALAMGPAPLSASLKRFDQFAPIMSDYEAIVTSQILHAPLDLMLASLKRVPRAPTASIRQVANGVVAAKGEFGDELFRRAQLRRLWVDYRVAGLVDSLYRSLHELQRLSTSMPGGKRTPALQRQLDSLDEVKRLIERRLAQATAPARPAARAERVEVNDIGLGLQMHEFVVEFIRFHDRMIGSYEPLLDYAALVLGRHTPPAVVFLGPARPIDSLVAAYQGIMTALAGQERLPTRQEDETYRALASRLYMSIWAPVETRLGEARRVIVAPDGALCLLAFGTLLDRDGRFLAERHSIDYLDAARDLARPGTSPEPGAGLLALGDPDFDRLPPAAREGAAASSAAVSGPEGKAKAGARASCAGVSGQKVSPLPQTRTEVESAVQRWRLHHRSPAALMTGGRASEEEFKREAPGHQVLHLATHGFALTERCLATAGKLDEVSRRVYVQENPLLLSGLLLAGANMDPAHADSLGVEDGVLTAFEIAGLDLERVRLAVLSACETGLGVERNHEGLYGVRRAFHMAGVRTVVASLWPVPDRATAELIATLYDDPQISPAEQLRQSQLGEIARLRAAGLSDHPYSWGAFIVSGAE